MAKYRVTHTCGHNRTVSLVGKGTERERKLAWMAKQPCPDCLRSEELRRAETSADAQGLPRLDGTPKQIAWAERIRYQTLRVIDRAIPADQLDTEIAVPERVALYPGETITLRSVIDRIRQEPSSRWWIDHARRVQDIGRAPLYGDQQFLAELLPAAAFGARIPTTGDLAASDDLRTQLRALYQ